jgi:elongation factor G
MLKAVAEYDGELLHLYLEGFGSDAIRRAIGRARSRGRSFRSWAARPSRTRIRSCSTPSWPTSRPCGYAAGQGMNPDTMEPGRKASDEGPFAALAFKIMTDPYSAS